MFILVYYINIHTQPATVYIFQILKCLKEPTCAIFLGFKDIKYDIPVYQINNTQIRKYTNTKCLKDPICAIFLKSMRFKDINYDIPVYEM